MKKIFLSVVLTTIITALAVAQKARLNAYGGYVFDDQVDGYYDAGNNFSGTIQGGFQWGVGLEYMMDKTKGIELKYMRQDTEAPMVYFEGGQRKTRNIELGINYILLGGSNYFQTSSDVAEPYFGFGLGAAIINNKNPVSTANSTATKFAWNLKGGTNLWVSPKIGIKINLELLSAVQSAGGGLYFGTGGAGAGVSTYSSMLQFVTGGGLVFKLGQ